MKQKIILFAFLSLGLFINAQQLRYVDTDYILSKIPQYTQAKQKLEQQVQAWKSEITQDQDEIDELERKLENERVILTDDKIEEQESLINSKKEKLNQKIEQKFGINGASQQLRVNLVKPLQDQIWNAIATISKQKGYHMIFDKSINSNLIYADEKYDITDMVIKEMGLDKIQSTPPANNAPKPRTSNPKSNSDKIQQSNSDTDKVPQKKTESIKRN